MTACCACHTPERALPAWGVGDPVQINVGSPCGIDPAVPWHHPHPDDEWIDAVVTRVGRDLMTGRPVEFYAAQGQPGDDMDRGGQHVREVRIDLATATWRSTPWLDEPAAPLHTLPIRDRPRGMAEFIAALPDGAELVDEWRVTGEPGPMVVNGHDFGAYPRYDFTWRGDDPRWPGALAERHARDFVRNHLAPAADGSGRLVSAWPEGPTLAHRQVIRLPWEPQPVAPAPDTPTQEVTP